MRLSEIAQKPTFALLGPGFSRSPWMLLDDLTVSEDPGAQLFFAPYETDGRDARAYTGRLTVVDRLDLDVPTTSLLPSLDTSAHRAAVSAIREAIAAGDVYQVNYTIRAGLPPVSGASLVSTFCRRGVPSFLAWVRLPDGTEFVSASPELLFAIDGPRIRTEPMKGTAPGGCAQQLLASAKDMSELAMITDLLRNDLTPLCTPHSVQVTNARRVIDLPYAVQTVSDIEGSLQPGTTWRDVIMALHPGGSVTGAPRRTAMAMIESLETTPRGPYCGALGYIADDRAVASLLIRTATKAPQGWVYGVGGGIVWDSDADAELAEIYTKLGALQ